MSWSFRLELRIGDRGELVFADGLDVVRGDRVVQELLHDRVPADAGVDDLPRHLSLAEGRGS